jgi:hypothetical protein
MAHRQSSDLRDTGRRPARSVGIPRILSRASFFSIVAIFIALVTRTVYCYAQ